MIIDKQISEHFQLLQITKHHLGENEPLSLFKNTKHTEYWNLYDISNIIKPIGPFQEYQGYTSKIQTEIFCIFNFSPIKKSKTTNTDFFAGHVVPFKTNIGLDAHLTRYAIYNLINAYAPQNIFDLVYFMSAPNTPVNDIAAITQRFKRISERENLKQQERNLAGITNKYNASFASVQAILQNALFGNTDMHRIKAWHNIPDKSPTADYMGAISLNAKNNAIYNATYNIDTRSTNYDTFIKLLQKSAYEQRTRMHIKYGITPENDLCAKSVSNVQTEFNQMRKNFIRQYASETLR